MNIFGEFVSCVKLLGDITIIVPLIREKVRKNLVFPEILKSSSEKVMAS